MPLLISDVYIENHERFRKFVEDLNKLCLEEKIG
jgi:hypothetical protein